ncbi:MAG TPA: hypothetical protein VGB24_15925 [Longimicrobium sp.]|jgi:Flp pilus assembly protein TadB|uniref:hypothetical protein n=1 Tax=Longimicrobium sp. TaxID=2029185 RepID=UPI002ED9BF45
MDDRERLQWLVAQARRGKSTSRANLWSITFLHASPLLAACLLALLLGRPEVAAATLALVLLTLGLVRTAVRPRRMVMAPARHRVVRYGR